MDQFEECDHEYETLFCLNCGGYMGEACIFCGDMTDGGDHMASQTEAWCDCGDPKTSPSGESHE